jgi:hypothetical protein
MRPLAANDTTPLKSRAPSYRNFAVREPYRSDKTITTHRHPAGAATFVAGALTNPADLSGKQKAGKL